MNYASGKTTFGPQFFVDVGRDPDKWVASLRVRLGTDIPTDEVLRDFFDAALNQPSPQKWQTMDTAPKGGGAKRVDDPKWVEPPQILIKFDGGEVSVAHWDWYYAEGGAGYRDGFAWIEPCSGEQLNLHYGQPVGWMPIPD